MKVGVLYVFWASLQSPFVFGKVVIGQLPFQVSSLLPKLLALSLQFIVLVLLLGQLVSLLA